jgi:hypothetical protein
MIAKKNKNPKRDDEFTARCSKGTWPRFGRDGF